MLCVPIPAQARSLAFAEALRKQAEQLSGRRAESRDGRLRLRPVQLLELWPRHYLATFTVPSGGLVREVARRLDGYPVRCG